MSTTQPPPTLEYPSPLNDPRVRTVLDRLHAASPGGGRSRGNRSGGDGGDGRGLGGRGLGGSGRPTVAGGAPRSRNDPFARAGQPLAIKPEQGDLIYLLCRALNAKRVVDFATSTGVSAIYSAAAVRDNGGGIVIGAEIVPEKAQAAERNLAEAGLDAYVEVRVGDARETLRDVGGAVDFALIDGFPLDEGPSLARQVMDLLLPTLRVGAMLMNDNGEPDYLELVRDPTRGFRSLALPIKGSTELSVKVA